MFTYQEYKNVPKQICHKTPFAYFTVWYSKILYAQYCTLLYALFVNFVFPPFYNISFWFLTVCFKGWLVVSLLSTVCLWICDLVGTGME